MNLMLAMLFLSQSGARGADGPGEEEARKAIEKFRMVYKSSADSARAGAAAELGRTKHEKVIPILAALLMGEAFEVRAAAARALGGFDDPRAVESLSSALLPNAKNRVVVEALAKALETADWEAGGTALSLLLKKHDDNDVIDSLGAVVGSLGKLGSPSSVEPLIELLKHCENEGQGGGRRYKGEPKMQALRAPIAKALTAITGTQQSSARLWADWWRKNQERALSSATIVYRCRNSGKRWPESASQPKRCPDDPKSPVCIQVVKTSLKGSQSGR